MQENQHHQFIIIGAGLSGLHAALILAQHQKDFIIIQATNVIGGRIATQTFREVLDKQLSQSSFGVKQQYPKWANSNEKVLDIPIQYGATWIAESHKYLFKLLKYLQIQTFKQNKNGPTIFGKSEGNYKFIQNSEYYSKQTKQRQLLESILNKYQKLRNKFLKLYQQAIQNKYNDKIKQYQNFVNKYDSISVKQFLQQQIQDQQFLGEITNFIECLQCISCDKLSMLQIIDDEESMYILYQVLGDKQVQDDDGYRVKCGMISIIKKMFEKIQEFVHKYNQNIKTKNLIRFNQPVIKIQTWQNQKNKTVKIHVNSQNGIKCYTAKRVLNSIPIGTLNKVSITNLSKGKSILFNNQQLGNVHRVFMVFRQPFWRKIYNGYGSFGIKFPFNQITEVTPFNNSCGILIFVFYADKYEKWIKDNPDPQARFTYLKNTIADMLLKGDRNSQYLRQCFIYKRTFFNHQYIKAAYQSIPKLGAWKTIQDAKQDYEQSFSKDQNGVYYIGSQFDEQYGSFMQGSIRITRRKVFQLLSKSDPWKQ